jgi:hypothetical protein
MLLFPAARRVARRNMKIDREEPMTLSAGFVLSEAQLLLEIAQQTYLNTPSILSSTPTCGVPSVPAPSGWKIVNSLTPTTATLLDNYWQVWQNQSNAAQYAIAVRGTVDTRPSVLADLLLPLINARFELRLGDGFSLPFHLAQDEGNSPVKAGVHSGFALSLLLMLFTTDRPLFSTLLQLAQLSGNAVYITGHSQGASIATLLTSLVGRSTLFRGPNFKTYTFAPAKPGNDHYGYDYDQLAGVGGYGWAVVSTQDWVPQVPPTLETFGTINTPNPLYKFGGAPNALATSSAPALSATTEAEVKAIRAAAEARLRLRVEALAKKLESEPVHLHKRELGSAAGPVTGSSIADLIKQILNQIQDSLNFAKAGALVPLFAAPGGNPTDGTQGCQAFDAFWQHHPGNYLKYLNAQY